MIYSQSIVYALEALGYLAAFEPNRSMKVKEMAKSLDIPEHYLGKVLTELVRKKFVTSTKGPTGGFQISPSTRKMTIYRILASLDGLTALEDNCVMGLKKCSDDTPCVLHESWSAFKRDAIVKIQNLTLQGLSKIIIVKYDLKT